MKSKDTIKRLETTIERLEDDISTLRHTDNLNFEVIKDLDAELVEARRKLGRLDHAFETLDMAFRSVRENLGTNTAAETDISTRL